VPPDGLAILNQGRDRLAELPGELAALAGLAIIDLAHGMHGEATVSPGFTETCAHAGITAAAHIIAAGDHI
jgi:hypothetical protein